MPQAPETIKGLEGKRGRNRNQSGHMEGHILFLCGPLTSAELRTHVLDNWITNLTQALTISILKRSYAGGIRMQTCKHTHAHTDIQITSNGDSALIFHPNSQVILTLESQCQTIHYPHFPSETKKLTSLTCQDHQGQEQVRDERQLHAWLFWPREKSSVPLSLSLSVFVNFPPILPPPTAS